MSEKWNQRYAQATSLPDINPWLYKFSHLIPHNGSALDLACGLGQNALFLAKHGLRVEAWDSSEVAIDAVNQYAKKHNLAVQGQCVDITQAWPTTGFDFICVSAFLERDICPQIITSLKPGGILFYQTFNQIALPGKPSNPDYLLQAGELLSLFKVLMPLVYWDEQDAYTGQNKGQNNPSLAGKALLIARK